MDEEEIRVRLHELKALSAMPGKYPRFLAFSGNILDYIEVQNASIKEGKLRMYLSVYNGALYSKMGYKSTLPNTEDDRAKEQFSINLTKEQALKLYEELGKRLKIKR